ncbi:MAG TPA: zinc ribbon domain-containing protein [Blastocatellia bacterium]|nr:zinc ribbon domain-containing protein [Blastocatellia bacterium]
MVGYCPKCGSETVQGFKFCKSCGTNIQVVADALDSKDDPFHLKKHGIDVEQVKRSLADLGTKLKTEMTSAADEWKGKQGQKKLEKIQTVKPREYLRYSWQHNLRNGLIALFGGVGSGIFLYYIAMQVIAAGTLKSLELRWNINGLEQIASWIWLLALPPTLKGIAQLIYAAFFAESIATLSQRFAPPTPVIQQVFKTALPEPPPSVTEDTTEILGKDQGVRFEEVGLER